MNDSDWNSTWYSLRGLCLIFLCVHTYVCVWVYVWRLYTCMGWSVLMCAFGVRGGWQLPHSVASPPWPLEAGALAEPGVRLMAIKSWQFWKHWYCTHVWSHELLMWVTES